MEHSNVSTAATSPPSPCPSPWPPPLPPSPSPLPSPCAPPKADCNRAINALTSSRVRAGAASWRGVYLYICVVIFVWLYFAIGCAIRCGILHHNNYFEVALFTQQKQNPIYYYLPHLPLVLALALALALVPLRGLVGALPAPRPLPMQRALRQL